MNGPHAVTQAEPSPVTCPDTLPEVGGLLHRPVLGQVMRCPLPLVLGCHLWAWTVVILFIPHCSGGWTSKVKVPAQWFPCEGGPIWWLAEATFSVLTQWRETGKSSLLSFLMRVLIPSWAPTLVTSSEPNYLPKVASPNTVTWGLGLQHVNWG